ncbi:MAG: peptidylprolyl isomerase [Candidatus Micrarchaeota archaeon]|nr:peptidylprolyl isomerase [Candidatus Micrarchaeota archaeon]
MLHQKILSNPLYIVIIVVIILAIAGSALVLSQSSPSVAAGDNISVYYTGQFTNGSTFGSNVGGQPLTFKVGAGQVIPGFDNGVIGMKLNETKTLTIPANQAYGDINPSLFVNVPKTNFGNKTVQDGMTVTEVSQNGTPFQGTVAAVNATTVVVNFNPPLAGHTLVFTIKVVKIQK